MTNSTYKNGFDLRVIPDGIRDGKLRLSLCFKPNGRKVGAFPLPVPEQPLPNYPPDFIKGLEAVYSNVDESSRPSAPEDMPQIALDHFAPPRIGPVKPDNDKLQAALHKFFKDYPHSLKNVAEIEIERQAKWLESLPTHIEDQLKAMSIFIDDGSGIPQILDFMRVTPPKNEDVSGTGLSPLALWQDLFKDEFKSLVRAIRFPDGTSNDPSALRAKGISIRSDAASSVAALMSGIKLAEVELGVIRAAIARDRNHAHANEAARGAIIDVIRSRFTGSENENALVEMLDSPEVQAALFDAPFDKDLGAGVIAKLVHQDLIGILGNDKSAGNPNRQREEFVGGGSERDGLAFDRAIQAVRGLEHHSGQRVGTVSDDWFVQLHQTERNLLVDFDTRLGEAQENWGEQLNGDVAQPFKILKAPSPRPNTVAAHVKSLLSNAGILLGNVGNSQPDSPVAEREDNDPQKIVRTVTAQTALAERSQAGNPASAEPTTNAQNSAFKRFMDLNNHPALAAYLGLVVDVEIPLDKVKMDGLIRVCARPATALPVPAIWTMSWLARDTDGAMGFRPASLSDASGDEASPTSELRGGVLNLAQITPNGDHRYLLETLDPRQASETLRNRARMAESEIIQGTLEQDIEGVLPAIRTLGVSLVDSMRREAEIDGLGAALAAASIDPTSRDVFLWAENLMIGTRLDIGLVRDGKTDWYSAFERAMGYRFDGQPPTDGIEADIETANLPAYLQERSHGLTMPLNRFVDDPNSSETETGEDDLVAQEVLVTWQGGNSALPHRPAHLEHEEDPWFDPIQNTVPTVDLHSRVGLTQYAPDPKAGIAYGQARGAPALRDGQRIFLGMRPVYPNRGGPGLIDAIKAYDAGVRMGLDPDTPLVFGRNEPLLPPKVLLRNNPSEPLFKYGSLADFPGETDQTMVLRDVHFGEAAPLGFAPSEEYKSVGTIERYIVPPRIDFLSAEVAGGFDVVKEDFPLGLFGHDPIDRVLATGGFPIATGKTKKIYPDPTEDQIRSDIDALQIASKTPKVTRNKDGRGELLGHVRSQKKQGDLTVLNEHYYPDPLARKCVLMLVRDGQPILDAPIVLEYYHDKPDSHDKAPDRNWPNAVPILLRLLSAEAPEKSLTAGDERSAITKSVRGSNGILVNQRTWLRFNAMTAFPTVEIRLPSGEACELHVWSLPQAKATATGQDLSGHGLVQRLLFADASNPLRDALLQRLNDAQITAPISGLTPALVIPLKNATQKPIRVPEFTSPQVSLIMKDFTADIQAQAQQGVTDQVKALSAAWREWSKKNSDPTAWQITDNDLRATTAFFAGDVGLDRRSSGNMLLQAKWEEYNDDPARPLPRQDDEMRSFKPLSGHWRNLATTRHQIPGDEATIANYVQLHKDDDGLDRCSYHDFGDTSHRRVHLRPAANSRFETLIRNHTGDADFHVSPERHDDLPEGIVVHIPATERPPKPVFEQDPLPVFTYERGAYQSTGPAPIQQRLYGVVEHRHARTRLFLKRPWFARGAGQKMALLLYDHSLLGDDSKPLKPDAWLDDEDLRGMRNMITMRARDPEVASDSIPNFITQQDLLNDDVAARRGKLDLFNQADENSLGQLSAASFEVFPDRQRDIWLCDIDIATQGTYMPFLFMGLAAIQLNCIPGQELSQPVQQVAQIPPDRDLRVLRSLEQPRTLRISLDGDKYWQREPGPLLAEFKGLVDHPWISTVFQKRRRGSGDAWRKVEGTPEDRRQAGQSMIEKSPSLFDFQIELPKGIPTAGTDDEFEFAIEISEFEMVAADAGIGRVETEPGLEIVDVIQVSPDGLSAIIRGKTTYSAQITFSELEAARMIN